MTEARNDTPGDSSWPPAHPSIPDRDSATSASPGTPDPILGAIVNEKYRIVALLATGGMGRVYSAEQLSLGRMVAVKVLFPVLAAGDPNATGTLFRRRFLREASVLAKLQHPNIVTVFDYGRIETPTSDRERFFIAMELLEGETLQDRLNRGPLREPEALEFLRQTARGLRAAHDRGIVHRDLKPSNLMIANAKEGDSALKLLDFGVTKVLGEKNQELTDEGAVIGSPRFMSPEQVGGVVDARTDIYSLGIIAFTMLTGRPPFMGETSMLTMMAHLNTPLPSLVVSRPDLGVSEWLDEIIQQCCEKDPADRFQSAQELLDALSPTEGGASGRMVAGSKASGRFTSTEPAVRADLPPVPGGTRTDSTIPPMRGTRSRVPLLMGAGLAVMGAAAFLAWGRTPKPPPAQAPAPVAQTATSHVSVTSTPTDVEVYVDGTLLGRTPLTTSLPGGSAKTHLELRRAGYALYARDIDATSDLDIVAVLSPDAVLSPHAVLSPDAPRPLRTPAPVVSLERRAPVVSRPSINAAAPRRPAPSSPPSASPSAVVAPSSTPPPAIPRPDPVEDRQ